MVCASAAPLKTVDQPLRTAKVEVRERPLQLQWIEGGLWTSYGTATQKAKFLLGHPGRLAANLEAMKPLGLSHRVPPGEPSELAFKNKL